MTTENSENKTFNNSFGFKIAIFNQTIKDSLRNTFGMNKQSRGAAPMADVQMDEIIQKVKNLKKFIETSHKSIKKIISNMEDTIAKEQTLVTLFSEEGCKACKDNDLKMTYTSFSEDFRKDSKELSKYITSLKYYEEWLDTFLNKVIRDTEDTINTCHQVRIEIQAYTNCIISSQETLKTENPGSIEYRRIEGIISESEDLREKSKARYAQLKIQLTEKVDMLELKRQVDLPNYLKSVQAALRLYHQTVCNLYAPPNSTLSPPSLSPLPSPSLSATPSTASLNTTSKIEKPHLNNEDACSIRSLPSSKPTFS